MASGYTSCPCCGYDTVSDDETQPELCSDCEDVGCDDSGDDPRCASLPDDEFEADRSPDSADQADREGHPCDSASECLAVVGEPCRWATCPLFGRIVVSPGDHAHHSEVQ